MTEVTVTVEMLAEAKAALNEAGRLINKVMATDAGMKLRDARKFRRDELQAEYELLLRGATDDVLLQHDSLLARAELKRRDDMIV